MSSTAESYDKMTFRNYLAGTIFAILLIWGPIDHSWPYWLIIRIGYLILLPLLIWLSISLIWNRWLFLDNFDFALNRILSGIITIGLVVLAYLEATSTTHIVSTQTILTREGYEDVGDYIELPGPDYGNAITILIIASFFLWLGVLRKRPKDSNSK